MNEMNAQGVREKLFSNEEINCTQTEYHRDVRDAILDFQMRQNDLGNREASEFCQKQLERLDAQHGLPPK